MTIGHDTLSTPGGSMTFNFFFHSESAISSTPKKNEWRHSLIVQYYKATSTKVNPRKSKVKQLDRKWV